MKKSNQQPSSLRKLFGGYAVIWLVAGFGFAFSITAFWMLNKQFSAQHNLEFTWVAQNRNRLLKQGMENALEPVRMTRDFVQSTGEVTRNQFHLIAKPLLRHYPEIEMIGLIFPAEQKHPVQLDNTSLAQPTDAFSMRTYVETRENTSYKSGFDSTSQPAFKDAIQRARKSRGMAVSERVKLLGQEKNKYGVMAILPFFTGTFDAITTTRETKDLKGFVVAVLNLDELAHVAISYLEPRGVDLLIHDESANEESRFLEFYASRLNPTVDIGEEQLQQRLANTKMIITEVVQMADRQWSITAVPNARFRSVEAFAAGAWVVLGAGILLTMLLCTYLLRMKQSMQERLSMSQELKDQEALFWQMTESVDDIFWAVTADDHRFLYVSPAFETVWGNRCDAAYQDPKLFTDSIHSDDRYHWFAALEQAKRQTTPVEIEYRIVRRDSTQRWIRDTIFPVIDESGDVCRLVGVAEDITEKKQAEDALRDSENKLRTLFNQSPDTIMTVDKEGKILLKNRGPALETSSTRVEGKHSAELLPLHYRKEYRQLLARVLEDGEVRYLPYRSEDSSWWEIRIVPTIENEQVTAAMVISTDITEKRNLQAQAIRNARLASIGVLATGVAHDINNPNNAIQTGAALLGHVWQDAMPVLREYYKEQGDFSLAGLSFADEGETLNDLIAEIKDNSRRINAIVSNLKHLGKKDASDLNREVHVNVALKAAARVLGSNIDNYTDHWTMKLPEEIPLVKGNLQQLEQVFINVMLNALQSLPSKNKGVKVESAVDLTTNVVLIRVIDQGAGIAEEDISRITEPFYTTRLESGGTGLGLSISSTIIENHGGSIIFKSTIGIGTTVTIKLPILVTA